MKLKASENPLQRRGETTTAPGCRERKVVFETLVGRKEEKLRDNRRIKVKKKTNGNRWIRINR
jgi:hypothetical protein